MTKDAVKELAREAGRYSLYAVGFIVIIVVGTLAKKVSLAVPWAVPVAIGIVLGWYMRGTHDEQGRDRQHREAIDRSHDASL